MKSFWTLSFIILSFCIEAQELKELRHFTTTDYSADFYISLDDKKVKYVDTLNYYWFKSQKVHITQGYAGGDLLNGSFTKFYVSGQLAERGEFEFGLQIGEWKTWYETGQLESIYNYENGVLDGNYFKYNESGKLIESGNYRNGKFHGDKIENGETIEYKNGKRKEKKKKKIKEGEDSEEIKEDKKENFWSRIFKKKSDEEKENNKQKKEDNKE